MKRGDSLFEDFARGKLVPTPEQAGRHKTYCRPSLAPLLNAVDFASARVFEFPDFTDDFTDDFDNRLSEAGDDALDLLDAGLFHLPHPLTVMTWRSRSDFAPDVGDASLLIATEDAEGKISLLAAGRAFGRIHIPDGIWAVLPGVAHVTGTKIEVTPYIEMDALGPQALRDQMVVMTRIVLGVTVLLAHAGHVIEVEPVTAAQNRLRRARGFRPLPAEGIRRVIHLNPVIRTRPQPSDGATGGTSKAPHDRRAHLRRLKSGKVIPIRAMRVKGGAVGPVIVDVVE